MRRYEEFDSIPIPEDIPEIGVEAGTMGTVLDVLGEGERVVVDVSDEEGRTLDLVELDLDPEPRVALRWHLGK